MFLSDWPSPSVQDVMLKDSAVHCNAVFFPPIVVVAYGYFGGSQESVVGVAIIIIIY
jgi:hypothetical protein